MKFNDGDIVIYLATNFKKHNLVTKIINTLPGREYVNLEYPIHKFIPTSEAPLTMWITVSFYQLRHADEREEFIYHLYGPTELKAEAE